MNLWLLILSLGSLLTFIRLCSYLAQTFNEHKNFFECTHNKRLSIFKSIFINEIVSIFLQGNVEEAYDRISLSEVVVHRSAASLS